MDTKHLKAVSPLISTVIIIAIAFTLGALIAPYTFELVSNTTGQTGQDVTNSIRCRNLAYDFVTSFGIDGVNWNFSGVSTLVEARLVNTGTINIYNFSFEILMNSTGGLEIRQYTINSTHQKTISSPLKPGQSTILRADISEDLNGTLREVKIRNEVCPSVFVTQEL